MRAYSMDLRERALLDSDAGMKAADVAAKYRGADTLSKLSRYETRHERGLYRALHELERRQAARQGRDVAPAAVVDVNISTPAG